MAIARLNKIILTISQNLKKEDVDSIKLLYHGVIGDGLLESASSPILLMKLLKEQGHLEPLEKFCEEVLDFIGRRDISDKIFQREEKPSNPQTPERKPDLPNNILDFVAQMITNDWKRLSRKLGLEEHIIEQIELDYPRTNEKCYQSLLRWKKDNDTVTLETLKSALGEIPRYDILRKIKSKFELKGSSQSMTQQDDNSDLKNSEVVILGSTNNIEMGGLSLED